VTFGAARGVAAGTDVREAGAAAAAAGAVAFVPVLGLAAAQGGYFPTAWGWASVPLLTTAAVGLALRSELRLSRSELLLLGTLGALAAWTVASLVWSSATADTVLEVERVLVYVAGLGAVLVVGQARSSRHVLIGLLTAITLITGFSLATRLFPDRIGVHDTVSGYRLSEPIGYWNGLGIFAAMGALLALAFAARARTLAARAGCSAVLLVLLPTVYFTFGRGAWIALAAGLVVAVAVDPRRLQLLSALIVLAPAPALAILIAWREPALSRSGSTLAVAAHAGHRVAAAVAGLAALNAVLGAGLAVAERRFMPSLLVRRVFGGVVCAAVVVAVAGLLIRYDGPVHLAKRVYTSFTAPPPRLTSLNQRLLNLSGTWRADLWRLAWDDALRHPVLGAGPGTYERYFLAHQPAAVGQRVRDAHNLYLETFAELGAVGLALLAAFVLSPVAAVRRARREPLVPLVAAASVAYFVHAAADWDWELPAVTLVALICMSALVRADAEEQPSSPLSPTSRWSIAAVAVAAALFGSVTLAGNAALAASHAALARGDVATAATNARRARELLPWSPLPWAALGRTQLTAGLVRGGRESLRKAVSMDRGDWQLWYELSRATTGAERTRSLEQIGRLYPRWRLGEGT
jgi:O-Antigen ligase